MGAFHKLPPESFAQATEKSGVSPAALAAGYTVFFAYSTLIGVFAIVLTFLVVRGGKKSAAENSLPAAEPNRTTV